MLAVVGAPVVGVMTGDDGGGGICDVAEGAVAGSEAVVAVLAGVGLELDVAAFLTPVFVEGAGAGDEDGLV